MKNETLASGEGTAKRRLSCITWFVAAALAFCLAGCGLSSTESSTSSASDGAEEVEEAVPSGVASFTVEKGEGVPDSLSVQVSLSGTTDDGDSIDEQYKASLDTKYALDLKPGEYELAVAQGSLTQGDGYYKCEKTRFTFDGSKETFRRS